MADPTAACQNCEKCVQAIEQAKLFLSDLMHIKYPEWCDEEAVAQAETRFLENGGTLAYMAEVNEALREVAERG